jgi:hypothetical protein
MTLYGILYYIYELSIGSNAAYLILTLTTYTKKEFCAGRLTMHLRKPFTIMTMGVTMVHAKCYDLTTGIYGQTVQGAAEQVDDFCDHYLAGFFTEGQTKY